ncbi:glycosyl hydrolase family 61-domain-containing protein [Microdochium bolleyi]|uniref:lytic cellulose monooxygenase (C4-dehydrogenating) n=1 Tax=Microdochium bolleyi TaxID=196109 RepID=A0A136IL91_9PEZI|nr:glycosyl hydrolase family 61-domain-containing protein [Microdochium bolleyi]
MKAATIRALGFALGATQVAAHATFQNLWVNGVDYISAPFTPHGAQCARLPGSNSPVTNVASNDIRCNSPNASVAKKCPVPAGATVTVEMHQQNGDRSCANEAIGGAHYGPVQVYMSSVSDASRADGSSPWFKIFADTWAKNSAGGSGDDDFWGTKDLNKCCGLMNVKIPADIAPGDYLLRAEALALHTAGSAGGAQFYMTCYQITVSGSGSAKPAGVSLPGAYSASDPGILVNIHAKLSSYTAPGPAVYSGGSTKVAGSACSGCEGTCKPGSGPSGTAGGGSTPTSTAGNGNGGGGSSTTGGGSQPTGCTVPLWGQCGGNGYTGCTVCASGTCKKNGDFYSQCTP